MLCCFISTCACATLCSRETETGASVMYMRIGGMSWAIPTPFARVMPFVRTGGKAGSCAIVGEGVARRRSFCVNSAEFSRPSRRRYDRNDLRSDAHGALAARAATQRALDLPAHALEHLAHRRGRIRARALALEA